MPQLDLPMAQPIAEQLQSLITQAPLPGLGSEPVCEHTAAGVQSWLDQQQLHESLTAAALWLLAGKLDRSHEVSQQIHSPEGSYWHGIMHRREGDFGNAKYWLRRAAGHAVGPALATLIADRKPDIEQDLATALLRSPDRLPEALVDAVERAADQQSSWRDDLRQLAWWEWQLLFHSGR